MLNFNNIHNRADNNNGNTLEINLGNDITEKYEEQRDPRKHHESINKNH